MIKNLTSRKFILSAVGCLTGILGIIGCNDNTVAVVAFIVLEILCIAAYVVTEGKIDAASLTSAANVALQAAELIEQVKDGTGEVQLPNHTEVTQAVLSGALDSDAVGTTTTANNDDGVVKTIGDDGQTTYFL